ncbi:pirin-related protein [Mizugakiibacter sediminis]|uniref:Pirin n=1 Tax=Mizugakiibacter sediminis TaxID=1475481 RepID=A0A0K8QKV7_9GAMM|nr:pirin family protein [Mizugakiibacter sediminis]GAP65469.1 pirin-related protein [Mizugakiibacter sediminis]
MNDAPAAQPILIEGRERDLGDGFTVRRLLPHMRARLVGPFIFFDHMGPARLAPGQGLDVRPHPHIGLATVTFLFEGAMRHRDSLGCAQDIVPGDVNWMTAGRGIVHSERTPPDARAAGGSLHGIQTWVALPRAHEEDAPEFHHHDASTLPEVTRAGVRLRLIAGEAYGERAPVRVFSPMFYLGGEMDADAALDLPAGHAERGVYVVDGEVEMGARTLAAMQMGVQLGGVPLRLRARRPSRVMLFGGAPFGEPRFIWWNFVSSSRERIEAAKADWKEGRFDPVPGEHEFIPLPER